MQQFLIPLIAYLIGSIPTAYIITRQHSGKDLRREGSRNIGTRNAYEVTGSKKVGIRVLILDILKGMIPLILLDYIGYRSFIPVAATAIVIGHCFPIWLRFHGGRGLATATGIILLLEPLALIYWVMFYFLSKLIKRNVHLNAAIATLCISAFTFLTPEEYFYNVFMIGVNNTDFLISLRVAILIITAVILIRHIEPIQEYITNTKA